jgi:hypothetical protein
MQMKYVMFWEYCPDDRDKLIEKSLRQAKLVEKEPENWGKALFPSHHYGWCKGLTIVEAEAEHITRTMNFWFPELKIVYKPLVANSDSIKMIQELEK